MKKILILTILIFSACNNSDKKAKSQSVENEAKLTLDFVKTFEGQLSGKYEIVAKLVSNAGQIKGSYFYKTVGKNINITGNVKSDGTIILNEFDSKGNQTGTFNGLLVNNEKIEGNWSKPDGSKSMPFVLIASNTNYEVSQTSTIDRYESITGTYEFEFNSDGESFGSVKTNYIGNNKFKFDILTTHKSGCTGEIKGVGRINSKGIGEYSDNNCQSLTFKFSIDKIVVEEKECQYHGMRCYFAGEYKKMN